MAVADHKVTHLVEGDTVETIINILIAVILTTGWISLKRFDANVWGYRTGLILRFLVSLFFVTMISFALEASRERYLIMECEEHDKLMIEKQNIEKALRQIKTLSGLIPICSICKKIRNDQGYWQQVEIYVMENSEADFSHGMCPDCFSEFYPDYEYEEEK